MKNATRGQAGTGAQVTATGRAVLSLYGGMKADARRAAEGRWRRLERFRS